MTEPQAPRRPLLPILSVAFVGSLGFSIVLPFLVFVVIRLGGNALVYGALGATYSAFQLLGAPLLGRWSDRLGRRRVLLFSQLGTLASWLLFLVALFLPVTTLFDVDTRVTGAFVVSLPLVALFAARALDGITGGNVSVANAYLADVTPEDERSAGFGKMAVASNLGFVLGPAVAGLLGGTAWGETPPVLAAIAVSVAASAIVLFGLEDSEPCVLAERPERAAVGTAFGHEQKECYALVSPAQRTLSDALRPSRVRFALLVHFLVFLAFNFFYIAFPVHAATALGWTLPEVGIFFSVMALMMALVQGPVLGVVSKVVAERVLVLVGGAILAAGFALYASRSVVGIYGATALLALGNGLMWPSLLALLSKAADRRTQGLVQGFASSSGAVASICGLLMGGVLYGRFGARVFLAAALIAGAAALVSVMIRPSRRHAASGVSPAGIRSSLRSRSR